MISLESFVFKHLLNLPTVSFRAVSRLLPRHGKKAKILVYLDMISGIS
jgi:hypothetical protein